MIPVEFFIELRMAKTVIMLVQSAPDDEQLGQPLFGLQAMKVFPGISPRKKLVTKIPLKQRLVAKAAGTS